MWTSYMFLKFTRNYKKQNVYLIIVQAVNVLLEFIYKDKYIHEIWCIWKKK